MIQSDRHGQPKEVVPFLTDFESRKHATFGLFSKGQKLTTLVSSLEIWSGVDRQNNEFVGVSLVDADGETVDYVTVRPDPKGGETKFNVNLMLDSGLFEAVSEMLSRHNLCFSGQV